VTLCAATGVAGLSIEDSTGDKDQPLYDFDLAVRACARRARRSTGTAAASCSPRAPRVSWSGGRISTKPSAGSGLRGGRGRLPLCARLRTPELIGAVIRAVAPKPVNIIMSGALGLTVGDLAGLGARRISVGSALARVAWGAVLRAAKEIAGPGRFDAFAGAAPHASSMPSFATT